MKKILIAAILCTLLLTAGCAHQLPDERLPKVPVRPGQDMAETAADTAADIAPETLSAEDLALADRAAEVLWQTYDLPDASHFRPDVRRHVSNGTATVEFELYIGYYRTNESYQVKISPDGEAESTYAVQQGEYSRYLSAATPEAIAAAEAELAEQLAPYGQHSYGYLTIDQEGYLCLSAEVIVELDGPSEGGCGVGHDHLFFHARICGAQE